MQTRRTAPQARGTAGATSGRTTIGGLIGAALGLALFVYFLNRAGLAEVVAGVARLRWTFAAILALSGFRFIARAAAWVACMDGPHRLRLRDALQGTLAGDAIGNLLPFSLLVSEPAKSAFIRHREPVARTLPALAVETLFYTLSAVLLIAGGLVATFLLFQTDGQLWLVTTAVFAALAAIVALAHGIIWNHVHVASGAFDWLERRRLMPARLYELSDRIRRLEERTYRLYPRSARRLVPVALWQVGFHIAAIAEIYLVLAVISDIAPTVIDAFIFESTNRFITFAFRFVPLRVGVDEAGTAMFADLLRFGATTGVTLAIVRKARMLCWIAVGVGLLVRRGFTMRQVLTDEEIARAGDLTPATAPGETAVVVMARSPLTGAPPKTRLAEAGVSEAHRRALYAAFLSDTIEACRRVENATMKVAFTPDGGRTGFAELGVRDEDLVPQRGDDLGARERHLFEDLFAEGFSKVVIVGSDLPTLPPEHLRQAIAWLDVNAVAIGPSTDGGYYLIGLMKSARGVPDLFSGIRWSTPHAYEDTIWAAGLAGLRVERIPHWYDVDDEAGLVKLREALSDPGQARRAPATAKALEDFDQKAGGRRQEAE